VIGTWHFSHVDWTVPGSDLPLLWADGLRRLYNPTTSRSP
jgi:hypothetical protein